VTQSGGDRAALRLIERALDAGINFFDTADIYGQGASERLLAKVLKGREAIIATKAGFCLSPLGFLARHAKPVIRRLLGIRPSLSGSVKRVRAAQNRQDFTRGYLTRCVDGSLSRLRLDCIDVFFLHSPATEVLERGEVFETLQALQRQGKIRHYGVSCRKASDVGYCSAQTGVSVLQAELNLLVPEAFDAVLPLAETKGVGVVARQALAGGVLLRTAAELGPESVPEGREWSDIKWRMLELEKVALEQGIDVARMALKFLVQTKAISTTLIGTTNADHLKASVEALNRPDLSPEAVAACSLLQARARNGMAQT
jgi:aryl-alcohol dehydrogenase-like predicted oxidoreductase